LSSINFIANAIHGFLIDQCLQNTSHPERYENPIQEGPGPIAADSLAAESTRSGGSFSENKDSEPLGVKGANSTFANTDISSATILPPAPDAEARQAQNDWDETSRLKGEAGIKYPEALGGQPDYPGAHTAEGYVGGPTSAKTEMQQEGTRTYQTSFGESDGRRSDVDAAPTYISAAADPVQGGPKVNNIKEGGFDANAPNASFTSDVGLNKDPGREAEGKFQHEVAGTGAAAGLPRQKWLDDREGFEVLGRDETA
jgi:hypothetical protein